MAHLVGISGSLRKSSFNTALLHAAAGLVPEGSTLSPYTLHGIAPYDGDAESETGIPPVVQALKDVVAGADGVILVTPEYNNSIPGVFKNAIDWMSRPASDIPRVFGGRPFAIAGTSTGPFGTLLAQAAWLPVIRTLGGDLWSAGRLVVPRAATVFDANGQVTDEKVRERIRRFVAGFASYCS